jgi:hypothetical protein
VNSYSWIRCAIRTTVWVAACLAATAAFGADAPRQQASAQLLDHAAFLCSNCLFGPSDYYYCFAADNKILIGYQRAPVLNWRDKSKNYLRAAHPGWEEWSAPGKTVPITYDDKHIWVGRAEPNQAKGFWAHIRAITMWPGRAHGKQVRLTQNASMRDIFANSPQCRKANQ